MHHHHHHQRLKPAKHQPKRMLYWPKSRGCMQEAPIHTLEALRAPDATPTATPADMRHPTKTL